MTLCQTWFSLCTQLFCFFVSSIFLHFLPRIYIFSFSISAFFKFFLLKISFVLFSIHVWTLCPILRTEHSPTPHRKSYGAPQYMRSLLWNMEKRNKNWRSHDVLKGQWVTYFMRPLISNQILKKKKIQKLNNIKKKRKEKKTHFTSKFRKSSQWIWQKTKITKKKTSLV